MQENEEDSKKPTIDDIYAQIEKKKWSQIKGISQSKANIPSPEELERLSEAEDLDVLNMVAGTMEAVESGPKIILIDNDLDLGLVGLAVVEDRRNQIERWATHGLIFPPTDEEAANFEKRDEELFCLKVDPYLLIQQGRKR